MQVIGLTGSIGTGKSTVGVMLGELGARVIDADKVAHRLLEKGKPAVGELVALFGPDILGPAGDIDRGKLAGRVFDDAEMVCKLNRVIHPRLHDVIKAEIEQARKDRVEVLVIESPLLFEVEWSLSLLDEVWMTNCPVDSIVQRLTTQRGMSEKDILSRLAVQICGDDKAKRAGKVIDTNCTKEELRARVMELWNEIKLRVKFD
jgi:dephospho-CoA kinase